MPYLLLAIAAGVLLAKLANKDRDAIRSQLDEKDAELAEAKKNKATKKEVARITAERDEIAAKLSALEAGIAARKKEEERITPDPDEEDEPEDPPVPDPVPVASGDADPEPIETE